MSSSSIIIIFSSSSMTKLSSSSSTNSIITMMSSSTSSRRIRQNREEGPHKPFPKAHAHRAYPYGYALQNEIKLILEIDTPILISSFIKTEGGEVGGVEGLTQLIRRGGVPSNTYLYFP